MDSELFNLYQNVFKKDFDDTDDFSIFKFYLRCKYQDIEYYKNEIAKLEGETQE